jgi:hypothetical protein
MLHNEPKNGLIEGEMTYQIVRTSKANVSSIDLH